MGWLLTLMREAVTPEHMLPLAWALPAQTTILREPAAELTGRLATLLRDEAQRTREPAAWDRAAGQLNNLSVRLSDLGQREAALAAIEEAVTIRRELTAARPDAFRPDLALSLNNLSNRLSDLGQRAAALAAIEEAVTIRRELTAARPDAFRPDLARSLGVVAYLQAEAGRPELARAASHEGIQLLAPVFITIPAAVNELMSFLTETYCTQCEALGREPDHALLQPVNAAFARLNASENTQ
jgi:tetratricopeptide (TPR) repeat protein